MKNKTELRTKIKNMRKTLDVKSKSKVICHRILCSQIFVSSKNVMLFYPTKYEVDLLELLNCDKNFYFPKVHGEELLVCPNCEEFKKSALGIMEPCSKPVDSSILDLIIVPALAVDMGHYRLGYGGGYYDRFLKNIKNATTITPIFKEFIFDELPKSEYDIKINYIYSD
jgi:5-formyltetrahydrofolate cyclo-ligase